jgi:hypothetical protein
VKQGCAVAARQFKRANKMVKINFSSVKKRGSRKKVALERIRNTLRNNHACYVLITCSDPSDEGKMEVEMSYDGDHCLASYLVDSAQNILEDQMPN